MDTAAVERAAIEFLRRRGFSVDLPDETKEGASARSEIEALRQVLQSAKPDVKRESERSDTVPGTWQVSLHAFCHFADRSLPGVREELDALKVPICVAFLQEMLRSDEQEDRVAAGVLFDCELVKSLRERCDAEALRQLAPDVRGASLRRNETEQSQSVSVSPGTWSLLQRFASEYGCVAHVLNSRLHVLVRERPLRNRAFDRAHLAPIDTKPLRELFSLTEEAFGALEMEDIEGSTCRVPVGTMNAADTDRFLSDLKLRQNVSREKLPSLACFGAVGDNVHCIDVSEDASKLAIGGAGVLQLWNVAAEESHDLVGHDGAVFDVCFQPSGDTLVSGGSDGFLRVWDTALRRQMALLRGHSGAVWALHACALGPYILSASADRTARLWSLERGSPLRMFVGHTDDVQCVTSHPNLNYVLTGSYDTTARMFDIQTGQCLRIFASHNAPVSSVAFSYCGKLCATAADNGVIIWDVNSAEVAAKVSSRKFANSVAFSRLDLRKPDEKGLLCATHDDGTVAMWDVASAIQESAQDGAPLSFAERRRNALPIREFHVKNRPVSVRFLPRNIGLVCTVPHHVAN